MSYTPNEIIIDPGHGWADPAGNYDPGHMGGHLDEVSLVDGYLADLCDVLLREGIQYRVLPTRVRPGFSPAERSQQLDGERILFLSCHIGFAKNVAKNGGHVYVKRHKPEEFPLAHMLADTITKWGMTTCKPFAGCKILETRAENLPVYEEDRNILGIQLEPFCLNAIDSVVYACRMRQLGFALGEVLVSYMHSANPGLRRTKTVVWENGPDGKVAF